MTWGRRVEEVEAGGREWGVGRLDRLSSPVLR